jgi:hypothetical protein
MKKPRKASRKPARRAKDDKVAKALGNIERKLDEILKLLEGSPGAVEAPSESPGPGAVESPPESRGPEQQPVAQ